MTARLFLDPTRVRALYRAASGLVRRNGGLRRAKVAGSDVAAATERPADRKVRRAGG
ncbi:hypothetical protein [Protofrankia symbiont of Coriaria ruscifolia]|uniref:Uncharacterized protein n=1 Tax=Candidatus Protofrankia californiensis TaxID=1839754 RepID=A0A1C3NYS6_9ACTN|nr:hypothetical protein [Protofrankia symbiont of Coriaria ruscifolia]SBW22723.1 hypothetical protein FDG2_3033 [Candidatus Protofrankia californiensis]